MSGNFERLVCHRFEDILSEERFEKSSACIYKKLNEATVATIAFVEGTSIRQGYFVLRLAIGLLNVGTEYAVMSKDLMRPGKGRDRMGWYKWADGDPAETDAARAQLVEVGLPWIDQYTDLSQLEHYLQENVVVKSETPTFRLFRRRVGRPSDRSSSSPRVHLNNLMHLSYCREAQGKLRQAMETWEEYGKHINFKKGSDKQRKYDERLIALRSRIDE